MRVRDEIWRGSSLNVTGSISSFLAISGQVSGNGTCTSASPREYIMSSGRQATKLRFCID